MTIKNHPFRFSKALRTILGVAYAKPEPLNPEPVKNENHDTAPKADNRSPAPVNDEAIRETIRAERAARKRANYQKRNGPVDPV